MRPGGHRLRGLSPRATLGRGPQRSLRPLLPLSLPRRDSLRSRRHRDDRLTSRARVRARAPAASGCGSHRWNGGHSRCAPPADPGPRDPERLLPPRDAAERAQPADLRIVQLRGLPRELQPGPRAVRAVGGLDDGPGGPRPHLLRNPRHREPGRRLRRRGLPPVPRSRRVARWTLDPHRRVVTGPAPR